MDTQKAEEEELLKQQPEEGVNNLNSALQSNGSTIEFQVETNEHHSNTQGSGSAAYNSCKSDDLPRLLLKQGSQISSTSKSPTSERPFLSLPNLSERLLVMEEIGPQGSVLLDSDAWRPSFNKFLMAKENRKTEKLPKRVRRYYKAQDDLIKELQAVEKQVEIAPDIAEEHNVSTAQHRCTLDADTTAKLTLVINLALMVGKAVASGLSGSLSIISSLLDSVVDLLSGAIIWWSERKIKKRDRYNYPIGKTRLAPVAIIILASVMSIASLQPIIEGVRQLISGRATPDVTTPTIVIMACTIGIKLTLFLATCRIRNPTVRALAQDHRNDVLSNCVALVCAFLGSYGIKNWGDHRYGFFDPCGAIVISLYIIVSWCLTGKDQLKMATGHTANPEFLQKLTWICMNHHSKVKQIDTVRAFHFGCNFLVEVDIVLPEDTPLRQSHDIGEALQLKLEKLPEVERAFVHLDYESEHHPDSEHKVI